MLLKVAEVRSLIEVIVTKIRKERCSLRKSIYGNCCVLEIKVVKNETSIERCKCIDQ